MAQKLDEAGTCLPVQDCQEQSDAIAVAANPEASEHAEEPAGDDLCDLCFSSGVNADRTTPCGKTIGIECGCDKDNPDGECGDPECAECSAS